MADCGVMCTSGGSPASRMRVSRSCMMLNASIMTVEKLGLAVAAETSDA